MGNSLVISNIKEYSFNSLYVNLQIMVIELNKKIQDHLSLLKNKKLELTYDELTQQLIKERSIRTQYIDSDLMGEPAWDMVLDLYHNTQRGRQVSVSSLCIASCVPMSTALRYINCLEEKRLVSRCPDKNDNRRVFIDLTTYGIEGITEYLRAIASVRAIKLVQNF